MKFHCTYLLMMNLLLVQAKEATQQQSPDPAFQWPAIEAKVDQLVQQYQDLDIFSGVVLIAEKGQPVYHKAFGLADRQNHIKNTLETKFDIGSMNKTFTKVVILQLVEQGKLGLQDKLSRFLPQFSSPPYAQVTIEQLLNHTSGFGDYYMSEGFFDLPTSEKDIASLTQRIGQMPLLFPPGEHMEYSNSGYILLGAVIERITGKTYHQVVKEWVVDPLGLSNTYLTDKYQVPNRAIGYFKTMQGELRDNAGFVEVPNPDGGFQATAADVMRFYREFHYGQTLLKESSKMYDEFFRMTREHLNSGAAIPHAGGFNGANSVNYEVLRDQVTITVLANMNEPVAEQLGLGILTIIRGKEPKQPALPAIESIYQAYVKHGLEFIRENFATLTVNFHPTDPKSLILNQVGYGFLSADQTDQAIELFQLNTELFGAEDANVWDSLGEAYLAKDDQTKALQCYEKALAMDPGLESAQRAVKRLKSTD
ncbi:serine hydrolase [Marinicella meishanensis]|uniref:serine hydrolase n=1 Tax=Marinicella meishanensis TaxID=2873263 RepID=UPI001CBE30FC|nr:serine hydrolase [Marinicella sp. NBU2979]